MSIIFKFLKENDLIAIKCMHAKRCGTTCISKVISKSEFFLLYIPLKETPSCQEKKIICRMEMSTKNENTITFLGTGRNIKLRKCKRVRTVVINALNDVSIFKNEVFMRYIYHSRKAPAFIYHTGEEHWYVNNNMHREDGPAVIYPEERGKKPRYFLKNMEYSFEDWSKIVINKKDNS